MKKWVFSLLVLLYILLAVVGCSQPHDVSVYEEKLKWWNAYHQWTLVYAENDGRMLKLIENFDEATRAELQLVNWGSVEGVKACERDKRKIMDQINECMAKKVHALNQMDRIYLKIQTM